MRVFKTGNKILRIFRYNFLCIQLPVMATKVLGWLTKRQLLCDAFCFKSNTVVFRTVPIRNPWANFSVFLFVLFVSFFLGGGGSGGEEGWCRWKDYYRGRRVG